MPRRNGSVDAPEGHKTCWPLRPTLAALVALLVVCDVVVVPATELTPSPVPETAELTEWLLLVVRDAEVRSRPPALTPPVDPVAAVELLALVVVLVLEPPVVDGPVVELVEIPSIDAPRPALPAVAELLLVAEVALVVEELETALTVGVLVNVAPLVLVNVPPEVTVAAAVLVLLVVDVDWTSVGSVTAPVPN